MASRSSGRSSTHSTHQPAKLTVHLVCTDIHQISQALHRYLSSTPTVVTTLTLIILVITNHCRMEAGELFCYSMRYKLVVLGNVKWCNCKWWISRDKGGKQLWHILRTIWHLHSKMMKNYYANSIRILLVILLCFCISIWNVCACACVWMYWYKQNIVKNINIYKKNKKKKLQANFTPLLLCKRKCLRG
jgi:hypothetical protein